MRGLKLMFSVILICMIVGTIWATSRQNLFAGGAEMLKTPWGWMTLLDAYFGFLTFSAWMLYKESTPLARGAWLVAVLLLGNIAMSAYVLLQLRRLPPGAGIEQLLLRRSS